MSRISIKAAPRGHRQGIVTGACGQYQVLIVVEPKPWGEKRSRALTWPIGTWAMELRLRELDSVTFACDHEDQVRAISAALRESKRQADREAAEQEEQDKSHSERSAEARLIVETVHESGASEEHVAAMSLDDLIAGLSLRHAVDARALTGDEETLSAGVLAHPLFRPILYRDFASEMVRLLPQVRRGYVERTEQMHTIRGRIESADLPAAAARSWLPITCTYEEFTHVTPLMRVLATALGLVTDRQGLPPGLNASEIVQSAVEDAIRARRALSDIPAWSTRAALATSRRLRLSRMDAVWTRALRSARSLLEFADAPLGGHGHHEVSAAQISWDSAAQWEALCRLLLQRAGTGRVQRGADGPGRLESPWKKLGKPRTVDIVVEDFLGTGAVIFADAKYKLGRSGISPADSYQLYYYADGHGADNAPEGCALLYPSRASTSANLFQRRGDDLPLVVLDLPFPSRSQASVTGLKRWAQETWEALGEGPTTDEVRLAILSRRTVMDAQSRGGEALDRRSR